MIAVCADDKAANLCPKLREENLLYAVYSYYSEENEDFILDGRWLAKQMPLRPYFALLIPSPSCKKETCHKVYDYILSVRNGQKKAVIAMDLLQDSWKINEMISEDSYDIGFNMDGSARVYHKGGDMEEDRYVENSCENVKNIFECSMEDVLRSAVPRKTIKICHNINA